MGNNTCALQNCYYGCCDAAGTCPDEEYKCVYYYSSQMDVITIVGTAIGGVFGVILIIAIACHCYRKRQQSQLQAQIAA